MSNITTKQRMPFYIVLSACALVVLGDLRNIITPFGYWALWGLVLASGTLVVKAKRIHKDIVFLCASFGFAVLVLALLIAGLANADAYTAYQAAKFIMIYAVFMVVYANSQFLDVDDFYRISATATGIGLVVFILSKYWLSDYYIVLGDGRQGSLFAYPGVLWKTSAFFCAFMIAKMLSSPMSKIMITTFVLVSSVYLLLADSSRTGFLWFAVILIAFASIVFLLNTARMLSIVSILVLLFGLFAVFNLDALYGFLDGKSLLVVNRLFEGDPIRSKMLSDGILNAEACLPLGCGFQSSTSIVGGQPMVIHNVYLAILGDLGALGEIGLLIIVLSPLLFFALREWFNGPAAAPVAYYKLAAYLGASCFCFLLLFHPLSSEMSEWGYWAIMLSWLSRLSNMGESSEFAQEMSTKL